MDRVLLTVALVVVCVLAGMGLFLGWRHRLAAQTTSLALPELPCAPDDLGVDLVEPLTGLYVSTTISGRWQERVVLHGLGRRAAATLRWTEVGVLVDRVGEDPIFLPTPALREMHAAAGIAGKVMGLPNGVLVVTWMCGNQLLDSGFRADDVDAQGDWIDLAEQRLTNGATT